MNKHINMLLKQAKFDLKCFKMRWRLVLRPSPRWGSLRRSSKPPNREGKPLPSEIPGYAIENSTAIILPKIFGMVVSLLLRQ